MGVNISKEKHITFIDEGLYLGDFHAAQKEKIIKKNKLKHVVQLFIAQPHASLNKLEIPIRGGRTTDIQPVLQNALRFINKAISDKENVLVHCKHGRNRSASIVIAYLMAKYGWDFEKSKNFVFEKRPILRIKEKVASFLKSLPPEVLSSYLEI